MKIACTGALFPEGKVKYDDTRVAALADKCQPKKVSPFYADFIGDDFIQADVIVTTPKQLLDVLIIDMELCENRLRNATLPQERDLIRNCLNELECEQPLCKKQWTAAERELLQGAAFVSTRPVLVLDTVPETNPLIEQALEAAGIVFFYTAGPKEVHAWPVPAGTDIVTCAGRIHSDLARGFIKADIVSLDDFLSAHNMNDARSKGLVRLVDRDYRIQDGDVIEIRFNV